MKTWRERRGLTQSELAERARKSQSTVARTESGEQELSMEDAAIYAAILETGPTDLFSAGGETVPLRYRAGSRFSEDFAGAEFPRPYQRLFVPPRLARPEQCFAAELADKSADRFGLAPGAYLIARELAAMDGKLRPGDRILVGRRDAPSAGNERRAFAEVLAGELAPNLLGDVLVALRTSMKELPPVVTVRAARGPVGLADRPDIYVPEWIDCRPRPGDEAEVLGRIERFIAPA